MISNQVLQTTIDGLKNITRIDICVMDIEGKALATTINNVEEYEEAVMAFVDSPQPLTKSKKRIINSFL